MRTKIQLEKYVIDTIRCISNFVRSREEIHTDNLTRLISSAVEHLVYTEAAGGSIPSSSISIKEHHDYSKMQRV